MRTLLLAALEVGYRTVRYTAPCAAVLLFVAVSAASVTGAHVQMGAVR